MTILDDRAAKAIQEAMDARVRALSANHPTTHMAEVIEIDQAGVTWVHIFGGADRTPAIRSLAQVKKGDLVTVTIEDGVVTINGSSSNPAASVEYVEAADYAIAEYAKQAMAAVLGDVLQVKEAIIGRATIEDLTAVEATVQTLTASYANLNEIVAGKATIVDLNAATARISQLEADDVTINGKITAAEGRIGTIESDYLKTTDMDAEVARVGTLLTGYAEADLANVNNAWIQNGVIKDAAITNEMVGSLSANKLTAGTINGANINVTNLNADNITAGTINGQRIGTGSLSLDKLSEDVYTETEVDAIVDGLNDRIDGAIETHTGTVVPTLNNTPASSWNTTDLKDEHVGDVYYVVNSQSQQNGYCYRFTKTGNTYSWQLIKDSDVTAALSRLETAEGKITTFDSDISTLKTDTGVLKTKTQTLETSLGDKVDTSTFNELSSTVDENSSTITSMSTVLTNNGLTSSTNITNTVNTVSQTASSNSSVISQLASTLGTNADGTTKAGDIMHRTSAVEQDLSTFKTTVSSTYATQTSVDNAQTDATNALNRQVAYSATSATAASTAAKVATCANFPALAAGVTVTVRFSTANTSTGAVTLNVNSTGAKTIYVNGAATASGNQLLWSANANITVTYDGTYWRVVSEPRTWYGTCSTAAATAAKTATINEIVVCKGTVVKLNMTYENTNTSATMNITSTGATNLYYGTTTTRPTTANGYGWGAASTATFVFDGQYWRVGDTSVLSRLIQAETTISSHTTSINQNAESIALKADSSDVYTKTQTDGLISTEVTNRNAAITAKANEITTSVSETYATKSTVNGIENRVTTAESTITQHATDIEAKVSKDGVIAAINVSVEQSGGSSAKISADKVNIEGAAIFTSGRLSQTSLNNAYDEKGSAAAVQANLDNLEVGGRNLLTGSGDLSGWGVGSAGSMSGGVATLTGTSSAWSAEIRTPKYDIGVYDGVTEYVFSFDYKSTAECVLATVIAATAQPVDSSSWSRTKYGSWQSYPTLPSTGGEWKRYTLNPRTIAVSQLTSGSGDCVSGYIQFYARSDTTLYIRHAKMEKGNIATDWTPAPEDLAPASAGVYYATCSTAAGTAVKVATTEQPGFTLVPGAMVNVRFTATNSAAVADLKLNVDGTGDKPIKYIYNNSLNNIPGVGYLLANNVYTFRYDGTNWVAQLMYNTDTQSRTRWQNVILAAAAMTSGHIICGTASGYKDIAANVTFDLSYPLLYCSTTKAAGGTSDNNFLQINGVNVTNNGTVTSAANYKTVYLVGTVSGNTFTIKASPFMTTVVPTSEDGFFYIPLGVFYNSTTNIYFNSTKDLYAFLDGKFRQVTPTEVVAEQQIYIQAAEGTLSVDPPDEWVEASSESVTEDEALRDNLFEVSDPYESSDFSLTRATIEDGLVRLTPTTSAAYAKLKVDYLDYADYDGKMLTASFEARLADVESSYTSENVLAYLGVNVSNRLTSIFSSSYDRYIGVTFSGLTDEWQRFTLTKAIPDDLSTGQANALAAGNYVTLEVAASGSRKPVDVRRLKLSVGDAVGAPVWTTKSPAYRSYYPVTFVATQRKRLDGTVKCTLPLRDDSTTIIDGGHIITGTIDANKVTVTNLNASNISSGMLSSDFISTEGLEVNLTAVSGLSDALDGKASSSDIDSAVETLSGTIDATAKAVNDRIALIDGIGLPEGQTGSVENLDGRMGTFENHISFRNVVVDETTGSQPAIILEADKTAPSGKVTTVLTNSALRFQESGNTVAQVSDQQLDITRTRVTESMQLGNFIWIPLSDGGLAFKWVEVNE